MSKTPMRLRCRCCGAESHSDIRHDRRQLMAGLVALAALPVLAACDRKEEQSNTSIKPVEISEGTACELDGMLLSEYPGPKGQIHFANTPEPAFYCDTMEVLNTLLHPEEVRKIEAVYVQDVGKGKADWDKPVGHWIDARTAFYVVGSKREGSMGPTLGSFSTREDAEDFAKEYGGKVYAMKELTPEMVDLRGGAHMDHSM